MIDPQQFRGLVGRVRAGDQAAASELVRQFEPEVRRYVRLRLTDPNLTRILDSADICQSVLATFFVRVAMGQFDLDEPSDLAKLLVTMARNKLVDHARKSAAQRTRDVGSDVWGQVADANDSPSELLANEELLAQARGLLSDEERWLAEERAYGRAWAEIAAERGETVDALRKKLGRALDRVCADLGVDGDSYG